MKKFLTSLKINKFYLIMCILSFLAGIGFFLCSQGDAFFYRYKILLLGFAPFFFFVVFTILNLFFSSKKITIIINCFMILLTISLFFYYPCVFVASAIIEFDNPITDVKAYKHKIQGSWFSNLFPNEIPKTVEKASFRYAPGFLQAGSEAYLYYIDNNLDLTTFKNTYQERAIWSGFRWQKNPQNMNLTDAFSNTPIPYEKGADFYIYLIEGNCDDSGYCNHGEYLFVALNENTNEVIFKGSYW